MTEEGVEIERLEVSVNNERPENQYEEDRILSQSKLAEDSLQLKLNRKANVVAEPMSIYSLHRNFGYNTIEVSA
jgi:hypothetical protein